MLVSSAGRIRSCLSLKLKETYDISEYEKPCEYSVVFQRRDTRLNPRDALIISDAR